MPPEKIRISFDIEGDLARAFIAERRKTLAAKTVLARAALVEYLKTRGYNVEDTTAAWGGPRDLDREEEASPEFAAAGA